MSLFPLILLPLVMAVVVDIIDGEMLDVAGSDTAGVLVVDGACESTMVGKRCTW